MKSTLVLMISLLLALVARAQTFTDTITKTMSFEKKDAGNAVVIANINGHVTVTGYDGNQVIIEVTRTINAKTQERLEKGKEELQLGTMDRADTLLFFVEGGCNHFDKKTNNNNRKGRYGDRWGSYGYEWSGERCDTPYDYKLDFAVKVPTQVNVLISTINNGNIIISKVKGAVTANNVNGSIKLTDLAREAWASTVNGNVDIAYTKNPEKDCRFYSLNGDINAHFQKGLAANMSFESFNGDLFTNVDQLEKLPVVVNKEGKGTMIKYKVNGNRFKIGGGGALLDFETFNGDVYIKE
uniref:Adhesin domain-containing protein n=1 Tax=uncultured bacterium BLR19 TaxID=506519 RepID=C0INY1_9BACT|nr:hypothetical protein AKSOIL_0309 [uncultured bacterium BLR19]